MAAQRMVEACALIDEALQYEASWQRVEEHRARFGDGIGYYGSSVGAIRATLRDVTRKYPGLTHDEITTLSSLLWAAEVYERRLAAVILLQIHVAELVVSDFTRFEGFLRTSTPPEVADALARDVIRPLVRAFDARDRARAESVLTRWSIGDEPVLRRAAEVVDAPS